MFNILTETQHVNYFICERFSKESWTPGQKVSQKTWCHLPVASPLAWLASSAAIHPRSARCLRHSYRLANKLFDQVHHVWIYPLIKQQNENTNFPIRNNKRQRIFQEAHDSKQILFWPLDLLTPKTWRKILMRQILLKLPMLLISSCGRSESSIFLKGYTKKDFSVKRF